MMEIDGFRRSDNVCLARDRRDYESFEWDEDNTRRNFEKLIYPGRTEREYKRLAQ